MTLDLVIEKEGRIAKLTKSQKHHRCAKCHEYILPKTQYYSVTVYGSGLGGIKFPSRVHPGCLDAYLEKVKRAEVKHKELILKQEKQLKQGEKLLAKGRELLVRGRECLK